MKHVGLRTDPKDIASQEQLGGGGATGTVEIDFGAFPGSNFTESPTVLDAGITATSRINVSLSAELATTDHTSYDHVYAARFIALTYVRYPGAGFFIMATSEHQLEGKYTLNWEWS